MKQQGLGRFEAILLDIRRIAKEKIKFNTFELKMISSESS